MRRVIFFGARDWNNVESIADAVESEIFKAGGKEHLLVIVGGARGADNVAEIQAERRGVHVARVNALWDIYHRAAGPIRNGVMRSLEPDYGHGFHPDIHNSKGSANMAKQLRAAGIPCEIHDR